MNTRQRSIFHKKKKKKKKPRSTILHILFAQTIHIFDIGSEHYSADTFDDILKRVKPTANDKAHKGLLFLCSR